MKSIPYGRQDISEEDIAAVETVLRSDWLTQGPAVEQFEASVSAYCGARHAVAVNSATSGLHLACRALGLGPGDLMWTVPNTFIASANAALYCNARIDFVDIDPYTYNMSVEALHAKLRAAGNNRPKIVMPVHFAGQSCEMERIAALGSEFGFRVIEDASHAIGGEHVGRKVGCCQFSDLTVFSFHPVKIVTTGEGGMVVTNDPLLAETVRGLRSHGMTRNPERMDQAPDGAWYYQQIDLGYNYRMTDIQAALGVSQMKRIDAFIGSRRALAARYRQNLQGLPLVLPFEQSGTSSAWHLYVVLIDTLIAKRSRKEVFDALRAASILVNVHYIPVHLQPYYRRLGFRAGDFPTAEQYYQRAISLPMHTRLSEADFEHISATLANVLTVG
jgi:UDP-4-amino-4,6-dideoxy-N-acetyl-beta-L-altrosamine transaminase